MINYMNWIKKITTAIALVCSLNTGAQNQMIIEPSRYNTWVESNTTCAGCGSFYAMVVNEKVRAKDGYYYMYVYLWSNSYYANGYTASSYIKHINFFFTDGVRDYPAINFQYVLVPPKSLDFNGWYQVAYLYHVYPNQIIKITWSNVKAW
jgi:hypothetical protein